MSNVAPWGVAYTSDIFFSVNATLERTLEFVSWQSPSRLYLFLDVFKNPLSVCDLLNRVSVRVLRVPTAKGAQLNTVQKTSICGEKH